MRRSTRVGLAAAGLLTGWIGWGWYVNRHTERVPYERLEQFDGVELRRYPRTVLVETTARDAGTAFGRLFRYLTGANEGQSETGSGGVKLAMTAPVRTLGSGGERISMTAPVRTDAGDGPITMAFFLPPSYTAETAPVPTDPTVRLVVEPPRTVAATRFAWYATTGRVERYERTLLETIRDRGIDPVSEPSLLRYNDPWTPPFMRRNEVVVEVDVADVE